MDQLEQYRREIDRIDGALVELFLKRMEVTGQVGAWKQANGVPVLDAARERRVIAAKTALTSDPSRRSDLAELYAAIMAISRRQQRALVQEGREDPGYDACMAAVAAARRPVTWPRVVYQGEPGAYSEEAAAGFFGEEVDSRGLPWFDHVFQAIERGEADYAVLPIENSSTGSIRQVYDLLAQYRYYIVGEYQVKVEHCLMALPGVKVEDIRTVYSHEQGLMQSEKFLDGHRDWKRMPTLDTAGSAKQVAASGDRTAAAICSRRAAALYGLDILAEGINHNALNYTRFVVVSPVMELRSGRDKISALFCLPHQSGSLHEILTIFSVQGLNLLKLESRPVPGRSWEYLFFLEFSGDLLSPGMDGVLHELSQLAGEMRILGNFQEYRQAGAAQPAGGAQ
ncbi:bifunctional chorismate mutase/prephenate dehydratase [Pseudoflavonifractor sp. 524-17]|uniref:bifunctional chorismate mutase/prephenate dehydratase n=1 Tax=Pseudoflavonifractor sp. 524-17 TaxID=2304577 RepID=UPI00137A9CD3|nr:bifunctional chorismate mutase/prephenate dehydratase [Pseudoflavonifractor sp. 524-17]NCE65855.1 bifunctional chorismate mutase/prephenate dehydratase [Pseudoflavonifractor sp. 524-17]